MTDREWALLFHLAGVVLLFSGMILATAAVAAGALLLVGTGLWLVEIWDGVSSLGDGWIAASLGLLALSFVLGALGGQKPSRRASSPRKAAAKSSGGSLTTVARMPSTMRPRSR